MLLPCEGSDGLSAVARAVVNGILCVRFSDVPMILRVRVPRRVHGLEWPHMVANHRLIVCPTRDIR